MRRAHAHSDPAPPSRDRRHRDRSRSDSIRPAAAHVAVPAADPRARLALPTLFQPGFRHRVAGKACLEGSEQPVGFLDAALLPQLAYLFAPFLGWLVRILTRQSRGRAYFRLGGCLRRVGEFGIALAGLLLFG